MARRKSFLVRATSPFLGPWVWLGKGEWKFKGSGEENGVEIKILNGKETLDLSPSLRLSGPVRIRAELVKGENVFLSAEQVT